MVQAIHGVGQAPAWIGRHGLNHDAYVAALRADEVNRQQAPSGMASAANIELGRPHRAASLRDGVGSILPDPADILSKMLSDWEEQTTPQRYAAAEAAAHAAARGAAQASAAAAVRTSYDALVVNAPQLLEMARSMPTGTDRRPPLSPAGSINSRLPSFRTRSHDEEVASLGSRTTTPPTTRPPTPGSNPTGDPGGMLSGFEAQRARLLAASARSAAAAADRHAQHIRTTIQPPERSTSPFARVDTPSPPSLRGHAAVAAMAREGTAASAPVRRQHSGSSDSSALGLRLAALSACGSDPLGSASSVSPSASNPDWAQQTGSLLEPLPVAAPVVRAPLSAAACVPVSAFASSSAQREGGDGGGLQYGGYGRGEQSMSPLSASSCSSLSGRSISPPHPLIRQVGRP